MLPEAVDIFFADLDKYNVFSFNGVFAYFPRDIACA